MITQYTADDEGWNRRMHGCIDCVEPVSRGKWAVSTGNEGTVGRPGVMFWGPEDDIMYAPAQEFHTSTREGGAVKFRGASPWNRLVIGCCYFHIVYGQVATLW